MIEMDNIRKHYSLNGKDVPILKGISLFIGQGEFVSIMGPSGSGKSTLSAILGCLSTPSHGVYKINGQNVTVLKSNEVARLRSQSIGFIFQDFNLLSGISALENVALPLVYAGVPVKERRERAMECLRAVSLDHKAANRPYQLSGGQKQRVAIARALVNHPKFLFADEPTGALDKKTGHEILGIMQKLNMLGHTVIQVTHSAADAAYSKRILHLVDGNIVRDETVDKPTIAVLTNAENTEFDDLVTKVWRVAQFAPANNVSDMDSLKHLMATSKSRNSWVAAARALVRWKNSEADKIIETLFTSDDWVVRSEVIKYASLRGKSESTPYFLRGLEDPNAWVRHTAMVEIKELDQSELTDAQQSQVLGHLSDSDERVRATGIYMLGKWKLPDVQAFFQKGLIDPDARVRANTIESIQAHELTQSMQSSLEAMLGDKNNRVRANAAMAVAKTNPTASFEAARQMIHSTDPLTRSSGAWLLGSIRPENGGQVLLDTLKVEKEDIVVNQIVRSLAKLAKDQMPLQKQISQLFGNI